MKQRLSARLRAFFQYLNGNPGRKKPVTLLEARDALDDTNETVLQWFITPFTGETMEQVKVNLHCELAAIMDCNRPDMPIDYIMAHNPVSALNDAGVN